MKAFLVGLIVLIFLGMFCYGIGSLVPEHLRECVPVFLVGVIITTVVFGVVTLIYTIGDCILFHIKYYKEETRANKDKIRII